jgi:hypothetical protein
LDKLIANRLVTAWTERIGGSGRPVEITQIAITEAAWRFWILILIQVLLGPDR